MGYPSRLSHSPVPNPIGEVYQRVAQNFTYEIWVDGNSQGSLSLVLKEYWMPLFGAHLAPSAYPHHNTYFVHSNDFSHVYILHKA